MLKQNPLRLSKNFKNKFFSTNNDAAYKIPKKLGEFYQPTIWYKFSRLAINTNSVNMGQGFPDWSPPEFLLENLNREINLPTANHQYTRSFGNLKLAEAVGEKYSKIYNRKIDPINEVLIANGAVSLLYSAITALTEQGDEVVTLEPFYDCYLPQIEFAGGKLVGVPMIPPKFRNKSEFANYDGKSILKDEWKVDFERLKNSLNEKTKILILNTPNNPTGKILSKEELLEIAKIIEKYPRIILLMDEVYEHMVYDDYTLLPRMGEYLWDRTISILSAGKFFSSTGIRVGFLLAPKKLLQIINSVHQFSCFCLYDPIQLAIASSLKDAEKSYKGFINYYGWLRAHYLESRNYFVQNLAKVKKFDCNFYMPEGSYFVIADISQKKNEPKYNFEGESENSYSKDFNYLINLAYEKKVVGIPCSPFYTSDNKQNGENYIRLAFCKQKTTLDKALANLA